MQAEGSLSGRPEDGGPGGAAQTRAAPPAPGPKPTS